MEIAENYKEMGDKKYQNGDYKGAIKDYSQAIRLKPDYADAYFYRGVSKGIMQDYKGAI